MVLVLHFTFLQTKEYPTFAPIYAARLGWIGVDLFFVLSGFLITGILLDAKGSPGYFRDFYARRCLRIFPPWYLFLFLFFVVGPVVDPTLKTAPWSVWWYLTYLTNFALVLHGNSGAIPDIGWSLAIEEQFYLLWPALVLMLSVRSLRRTCIGIVIVAMTLRGWLGPERFEAAYFLTPTRLDSLAIGAIAVLLFRSSELPARPALRRMALLLGTLIVVIRIAEPALRSGPIFNTAGYTIVALFFACCLLLGITGNDASPYRKVLRWQPLRRFGTYSYAIYLWHLVVKEGMDNAATHVQRFVPFPSNRILGQLIVYVIGLSLSYAVGWLSWNVFEKHILRLKPGRRQSVISH